MGTTLTNGVYLPNEGERNCYAGLKTNWEILDQKVADVTALQQAVAGALHREIVESLPTTDIDPNTIYMVLSGTSATENVYNEFMYVNNAWELIGTSATDLTNYYTKSEVDGKLLLKANASDLTSHTGDTTIHVTTADKNRWNNQSYVFRYSSTALVASSTNSNALLDNIDNLKVGDKVIDSSGVLFSITAIDTANSTFTIGTALIDLAIDSSVMHLSGNETASGNKDFSDDVSVKILTVTGKYISDEGSTNRRTVLKLLAGARDTDGYSCSYVTRVRTNKAQGALISSDVQTLGFDFVENQVRTLNTFIIRATNWLNDIPQKIEFTSNIADYTYGSSANKAKINDLNPSSLSMPDLNNGIDISSYITVVANANKESLYTPPANGWISVRLSRTSGALGVLLIQGGMASSGKNIEVESGATTADAMLPVVGGVQVSINSALADGIVSAYFYPCQGNV